MKTFNEVKENDIIYGVYASEYAYDQYVIKYDIVEFLVEKIKDDVKHKVRGFDLWPDTHIVHLDLVNNELERNEVWERNFVFFTTEEDARMHVRTNYYTLHESAMMHKRKYDRIVEKLSENMKHYNIY